MCTITASIKCVQMFSAVSQEEFRYMHYMCCTFLCCDFNSLIASKCRFILIRVSSIRKQEKGNNELQSKINNF